MKQMCTQADLQTLSLQVLQLHMHAALALVCNKSKHAHARASQICKQIAHNINCNLQVLQRMQIAIP